MLRHWARGWLAWFADGRQMVSQRLRSKRLCGLCFEATCRDLYRVVRWGLLATDYYFRSIYTAGMWMPRELAQGVVQAGWDSLESCLQTAFGSLSKEAFGAAASLSRARGWRLFYVRPKLHMMAHVLLLGKACCPQCICA